MTEGRQSFNNVLMIYPPLPHPPFFVNLGRTCSVLSPVRRGVCCRDRLLTLASTVLEIRGWIPRGCWCRLALWFGDLYYITLSSPPPSSEGKVSPLLPISPRVIEYLLCIWFWGGEILNPTPEACNSTPCNRSLKMWLSFSASGTWLINYMLASTFNSLSKNPSQAPHKFIPTLTEWYSITSYVFNWVNMKCSPNPQKTAVERLLWPWASVKYPPLQHWHQCKHWHIWDKTLLRSRNVCGTFSMQANKFSWQNW